MAYHTSDLHADGDKKEGFLSVLLGVRLMMLTCHAQRESGTI
jgi:hypothetical protein